MYTSFTIENFRCFEQLTVEPLARVNLICGENNTGKTALGVERFLSMTLAFQAAGNGIVLIDEVENALHHSAMQGVWENLSRLSQRFNVQVFATTHSYECMVAARDAFASAEQQDLHIHRLDRRDGGVTATGSVCL